MPWHLQVPISTCVRLCFSCIPPLPDASANFYRFSNDFLFSFESRLSVERHHHNRHLPRKKGSVKEWKKERERQTESAVKPADSCFFLFFFSTMSQG